MRENAFVAEFRQFFLGGGFTNDRFLVQLPVAGVENPPVRRVDEQRVAFGNRVRQREIANVERTNRKTVRPFDDVELDLVQNAGFFQLAADQVGGERRRIKRHAQFRGEIGHRADMVFMTMGEHDTDQILDPVFDEFEIGEHQVDARILVTGERHAQVDHQPLAVTAVQIDVHADFGRTTQRKEQQFFFRREILLHLDARSARIARPSSVRSESTPSNISVCLSNRMARPPVATTLAGRPISARILAINPSIIAT